MIASTIKQELPDGFQRAEFLIEKGQVDAIVTRTEMRDRLAMMIDFGTSAWEGYGELPEPEPEVAVEDEAAASSEDEPAEAEQEG